MSSYVLSLGEEPPDPFALAADMLDPPDLPETPRERWLRIARPAQLPPPGDWDIWLIRAGRGWGKTRSGAEWAADKARTYPGCRIALVAQTFADGRDTMVEGEESGLLDILDESELRGGSRDGAWNRSLGELFMHNGSKFKIFSSEKPRQLRGPQHHFGWADEPATWYDAHRGPTKDTTWSNLQFGMRLSIRADGRPKSSPRIVVTGTPQPVKLLTEKVGPPKGLLHRQGVVFSTGHSDDNLTNLAAEYKRAVLDPYRDTRLGRQELAGEVLEDAPGALVKRDWIDQNREDRTDPLQVHARTIGLDPGGTNSQALATVSRTADQRLHVEHVEVYRGSATEFLRHAVRLAQVGEASLVVEHNHGGTYLLGLLQSVMRELGIIVPVKEVWASQGKLARAERPALLVEQGRVTFPTVITPGLAELEDELCTFDPKEDKESPHALDAWVWAMFPHLGGISRVGQGADLAAVPYS